MTVGCTDLRFKKTKTGLEYRIVSGNGGNEIKYGNAIQFKAYSYYNDSLLSTPYDSVAQVIEIDSTKLPAEYVGIFKSARTGDSIVTRMSTDTIKKFNQLPPFAKSGYLGYRFKIIDIISDPAKVTALRNQSMRSIKNIDSISYQKQKTIDDKTLNDYLTSNNIRTTKTAKGTYVEIQNPGEGIAIDSGKAISVDYKGMTLDGKILRQSYDPATGKSIKPYTFVVGQRGAIQAGQMDWFILKKAVKEGCLSLHTLPTVPGAAGTVAIKPNTPLMFEVSVVDVLTHDQYQKKMEEQQKKMLQEQELQKQNSKQQQAPQAQPPQEKGK